MRYKIERIIHNINYRNNNKIKIFEMIKILLLTFQKFFLATIDKGVKIC